MNEKQKTYKIRLLPEREERIEKLKKLFDIPTTVGLMDFLLEAAEKDPQTFKDLSSFQNDTDDAFERFKEVSLAGKEKEERIYNELQQMRRDLTEIKAYLKKDINDKTDDITDVTFDKDEM